MTAIAKAAEREAEPKHTPLPWANGAKEIFVFLGRGTREEWWGVFHGIELVALAQKPEDARRIVRAANSHNTMLAALRECASRCRYDGDHHSDLGLESRRDASWMAMRLAENAIAKAEGRALPYRPDGGPDIDAEGES